jgi:hypothetical protein
MAGKHSRLSYRMSRRLLTRCKRDAFYSKAVFHPTST